MGAIDLKSLSKVLSAVDFPVVARDLAAKAEEMGADKSVIGFLKDVDSDLSLPSKEEVMTRAEEVSILKEEEPDIQHLEPRSPQDVI